MSKKITIGASALMVAAYAAISELLAGAKFPLTLEMQNISFRRLSFPDVGLMLSPVTDAEGSKAQLTFMNQDELLRVLSDIEQISEINGIESAVEIGLPDTEAEEAAAKAKAEADKKAEEYKKALEEAAKAQAEEAAAKAKAEPKKATNK